jgi:flavodoxin I
MAVGIFYGSNGGGTQRIAQLIKDKLGVEADLIDVANIEMSDFDKYTEIILGTSTWGEGDLQDDWDDIFDDFSNVDFSGKTVAFFGTGDQEGYPDNFLNGMGTLYRQAVENGASVVGNNWSQNGYEFDESTAIVDDSFVGLAIDEDNQDALTTSRVNQWVDDIKQYFID